VTIAAADPEATVIVCEDDAPTLELLCDHLEADRYRALPAPSAADALRLCHYKQPDLLVLDLNLPDAAGLDVLREIRASEGATGRYDPELPVIVLTGRGTDADRLRGFDCGADDYVVKPFAVAEIVARIKAVLRRRDGRRAGPLRVGEIFVDTARREVWVGDRLVQLANKEFAHLILRSAANQASLDRRTALGSTPGSTRCNHRGANTRRRWYSDSGLSAGGHMLG
jgi:DNA-binding response OmpR family regulator